MAKIYTKNKKKTLVYLYSVGNVMATVELAHPVLADTYTHVHLTLDELKDFVKDCEKLITKMETSEKYEVQW
jgi:hypothetical protein